MKKLSTIIAAAGTVLIVFILLFTSLELVVRDETLINNEYTKLSISNEMGIGNQDLVKSYFRLVDYMEGKVSSIDIQVTINGVEKNMFEMDQEHIHMQDVRKLWQDVEHLRDLAVFVSLVALLLAVLLNFKNAAETLSKGYLYGFFLCMLLFGFFGTWALLDFSSFWTMFHESLFWNNLWLFDPAESRMINMLPEVLFQDIVTRTAIYVGSVTILLLVLALIARGRIRKNRAALAFELERKKQVRALLAAGKPIPDELLSKKQLQLKREKEREERIKQETVNKRKAEKEKQLARTRKEKQKQIENEKRRNALDKTVASLQRKMGVDGHTEEDEDWIGTAPSPLAAKKPVKGSRKAKDKNQRFELILPDEEENA